MTLSPGVGVPPGARAVEVRVGGVVQGVGFRPFVHRLAFRGGLGGWVRNEAGTVRIHAEGDAASVERFLAALRSEAPPLARLDSVAVLPAPWEGARDFKVLRSDTSPEGRLPVSPDVAICAHCASELEDPADRRYRYPFITCTDCGPRFTVIEAMPYDRERSTMSAFPQCPACLAEYEDPTDRRYHSETNSCPACGPGVWLEGLPGVGAGGELRLEGDAAISRAAEHLTQGRIVALRGLGGFHLACDACDEAAVVRLRARKGRDAKPLAIMVRTLDDAREIAWIDDGEATLLTSSERPIVVLARKPLGPLAPSLAPGLPTVGVMLAYTPLHLLLLAAVGRPLVMTSGNASDEPIAIGNDEARARLAPVADALVLHDREIVARYDDSLVRSTPSGPLFLRRARGYAPLPVALPVPAGRPFLAVGPHLKNTLTLAQDGNAWVSQHVGDLENLETLAHFQDVLYRLTALFRVNPEAVVRDLHPGYLSTRVAEESGLPLLDPVQHHHAHIAAVQGEHGVTGPVLGLAFDGTGFGDDGTVWGCEFLRSDLFGYRRLASLRPAPLPGGDLAAREPWRAASGYLSLDTDRGEEFALAFLDVGDTERSTAERQIVRGVNAPLSSSMGRLFDAAAAVLGLRSVAGYEAQAAMELEGVAGGLPGRDPLPFPIVLREDGLRMLDPLPLLGTLGALRQEGFPVGELAARFHESVASASADLAVALCGSEGMDTVALGGGCFQNARLLGAMAARLREAGLRVLIPIRLGPNDGAVSYGQAVVAAARMNR